MGNWSKLKADEKIRVIKFARLNGVSDINTIRDTYNLYSSGGLEEILNKVNSSNANFVQRLKDPNRKSIPDWESPTDRISTHKLSVGTDENGNHYIFPEVQEINEELIDFTRPPYYRFAGEISAEMRGDTVRVPSIKDGIKFTETYKQYYPFNNGGPLNHKKSGNGWGESYANGGHLKDGTRKEESSFIIKSNKTLVPTLLDLFETAENNVIDDVENLPIITLFDDNMLDKQREKEYKKELENISYWHPPYTTSKVGDFQNINTLLNKETDYIYHKQKIDDSHYIPFIPEKEINVKGAKISSNMLDSLFKYAEQFNIPKEIALGLPMAETTLGYYPSYSDGFDRYDYFRDKGGVSPTNLLNYHLFYNSPYSSEFNYMVKLNGGNPIVYGMPYPIKDGLNTNEFTANLGTVDNGFWRITEGAPRESDDVVLPLWNVFNLYNDLLIKRRLPILEKQAKEVINENPYQAAFNYFLLGNYNPGDPNHTVNVYNRGKELLQLPIVKQILLEQAWKKSTGGPLYPFSFEKNPLLKTPVVRY